MKLPAIGDPLAVCRALFLQRRPPVAALAAAGAALFEVRDSNVAVPLLLALLTHKAPAVRLGAIAGLRAHPYPAAIRALSSASENDPDEAVRQAADAALTVIDEQQLACIQCGHEGAKLAPEPSSDPRLDPLPKPMFCDEACAVRWALAEAQGSFHLCVTEGTWGQGPERDCEVCSAAALVGVEQTFRGPHVMGHAKGAR